MKFDGQRKENNDEKHTCDGRNVFVSKYIAKYYTSLGDKVHVLNRNHHPQPEGTYLIEADRHHLGEVLKN